MSDDLLNNEEEQDVSVSNRKALTDVFIKQVASLAVTGMGQRKIAVALDASLRQVRNVYDDERFKAIVEDVGNDAVLTAKTRLRQEISKMSDLMLKALKVNLEKHSLEAVKVGLRVVGLDQAEEPQGNGNLTVIMANSKDPERVIEVKK